MFINPNWQIINNERVGVFYIEPYDEFLREEPDRIKVYDSDGRYFSYVPDIEPLPLSFAKYDKIVTLLQQAKNVIEVFDIVGEPGGEFAGTKEQMISYLHNELNWDLPREDYNPLANEYINRFDKIYVLLYD